MSRLPLERTWSPDKLHPLLYRTTFTDLLPWIQGHHMDPALRQETYSDLTTEIVSSLSTEDCDEVKKKNNNIFNNNI